MRWDIIGIVAVIISFVITAFVTKSDIRGKPEWGKAGLFFILMLLGMLAREVYNMLVNSKEFNLVSFGIAAVVSPIVFGGIYSQTAEKEIDVPTVILAFQNGFFWNAIFDGVKAQT